MTSCIGCTYCQGPTGEPTARWCNAPMPEVYAPASSGGPWRPPALKPLVVTLNEDGRCIVSISPPWRWDCPGRQDKELMIHFVIPIEPVAQMRMRLTTIGGRHARAYKAGQQVKAENLLQSWLWAQGFSRIEEGPILLGLKAFLSLPASWSKKKRLRATQGEIRPTKRPDLDNIIKHFKDCGNQVLWHDDAQIVGYLDGTGKYYDDGKGPRWEITILKL